MNTRSNRSEENYKLPKEEVSENKRQRRKKGDKQSGIFRSKGKISGDNEKEENQIVERIVKSKTENNS